MSAKKILHVDDDEPLLRMVARFLQGNGFTVVSTTSPFIAPIIQAEQPSLIIMDIDMPLLSGDKIVGIIRSQDFSTTPVIFFSGKPVPELLSVARRTAPADYVRKEDGFPALLAKINTFLSP